MKGSIAALAAIIVVIITILVFWPKVEPGSDFGPLLHIARNKVDLGRIPQFENREVSFLIENKGSRRLVLNEVSCDCGTSQRSAMLIQAGAADNVTVRLDTQHELGRIERTVTFNTNDVTQPRIDLIVVAQVTK